MSLVEVILAVSLIGLIILFLFGLLPSSGFMVRRAEQQMSATSYAEELMAELGSVSFETLKAGVGVLTPASPGILAGRLSDRELSDHTVLHPQVDLQPVDPVERLVQATVTISWTAGRRRPSFRLVRRFSSVLR
jgi:hypothetical protein